MVSSVDGAASLDGVTKGLSSQADRRVFALLRTLADVIVVGAATVRAEKYKPVRQHELWPDLRPGRPPTPPIAVITGRLDLDPASPLIADGPGRSPHDHHHHRAGPGRPPRRPGRADAEVIVAGQDTVDLKAAVGRAGRARPPPDARRGRPAPAGPDRSRPACWTSCA